MYIDKKMAHVYRELPMNLHFQGHGRMGVGEYVWVDNILYKMSCFTNENGDITYSLIKNSSIK